MARLVSRIQPCLWFDTQAASQRALQAMHEMKKLDIAALQAAFDGR